MLQAGLFLLLGIGIGFFVMVWILNMSVTEIIKNKMW